MMKYDFLLEFLKEIVQNYKLNSFEMRKYNLIKKDEIEENAKLGEAEYQFFLFQVCEKKDISKALKWLELAFLNGHKRARVIYIINLLTGIYNTKSDIAYAKEILNSYRDLDLYFIMGIIYFIGLDEKDNYKSYKYLKKSISEIQYKYVAGFIIGEILLNKGVEDKYLEENDRVEWIAIKYYLEAIKELEKSVKIYGFIAFRLAELYSGKKYNILFDEEEFLYYKNLALETGIEEVKDLKMKKNYKKKKIHYKILDFKMKNKKKLYQFVFPYGDYDEKRHGFIDNKGKIIIEPKYIKPLLTENEMKDNFIPLIDKEGRCGILNNRGEIIVSFEKRDYTKMIKKYGFLKDDKEHFQYEMYENNCGDGYEIFEKRKEKSTEELESFDKNRKDFLPIIEYGLKKDEEILFECEYDDIFRLKPGVFAVKTYYTYNLYIDGDNIEVGYKTIMPFLNNLAKIRKMEGSENFLNEKFEEIFETNFDKLGKEFKGGIIEYTIGNKMGIVDRNENIIIPPKYDKIEILKEDKKICVEYRGMKCYLNYNLTYFFRPDRDYIEKIKVVE